MRTLLILLITCFFAEIAKAQSGPPVWIDYYQRQAQYPADTWLTGFMSLPNRHGQAQHELLEEAEGIARAEMIESLKVDIASITTANITQVEDETYQYFKKASASHAKLQITGLKPERWYDAEEHIAYAFVYARKSDILDQYTSQLERHLQKAALVIQQAEADEDREAVIAQLLGVRKLFREAEEAQAVIFALGVRQAEHTKQLLELEQRANAYLREFRKEEDLNLSEAALSLASDLAGQLTSPDPAVSVLPFTYGESGMSSQFAAQFRRQMELKLKQATDWKVSLQPQAALPTIEGTYWEEGTALRLIANLRDPVSGQTLASAECLVSKQLLATQGLDFQPPNYTSALQQQQQIQQNQPDNTGLSVSVWTNKGQQNLVFERGERMWLFAQTNKAAYLRVVYYLADGRKVLLLDNVRVSEAQAGKPYRLPQEFVCAPPFGVERLQINACTHPFPTLLTYEQQGYQFVQEPTEQMLTKIRGFVPANHQSGFAEKHLLITTLSDR